MFFIENFAWFIKMKRLKRKEEKKVAKKPTKDWEETIIFDL